MAIRTKTKRRLTILAVIAVVIFAAGAGIYTVRMRQIDQQSAQQLQEGLEAFDNGDYYSAMHALGSYLLRMEEPDPDILYKYCKARLHVEEPNGRHLIQAASSLRRLLQLQPGHIRARRDLLELYLQFNYSTETIETADIILKDNSDDVQAIRAKAIALGRLGRSSEALELARRYNQLMPLDAKGYELTFTLHRKVGRPVAELITRGQSLLATNPQDPRSKWLMAYAYANANMQEEAIKWCNSAASEDPDPTLAIRIVNLLEYMGQYVEAFDLLERTADAHDDPKVNRELIRRLWQMGQYPKLVDRFSSPIDSESWLASAESETLGLVTLSMYRLGRGEQAGPFVEALQSRRADNLATAWVIVITKVLDNEQLSPSELIDIWQYVLSRAPQHPYFNYFIA